MKAEIPRNRNGMRKIYEENWDLTPCYRCKSLRHFVHKNSSGYFQIVCEDCHSATHWNTKENVILEWVNTYLYGMSYMRRLKNDTGRS